MTGAQTTPTKVRTRTVGLDTARTPNTQEFEQSTVLKRTELPNRNHYGN